MENQRKNYRRFKKNGLYGFRGKNFEDVIPCKWEAALNFREDLAPVQRDGKWGFINPDGAEVIPCIYDSGTPEESRIWANYGFRGGRARVRRDGKWGLIDPAGTEVIPCRWSRLELQNDGIVIVSDGCREDGAIHCGAMDTEGAVVIRCAWRRELRYLGEGLFREQPAQRECLTLLDRNGRVLGDSFAEIAPFSEGLAACRVENQYGFLNTKGEIAVPCTWTQVCDFSQGVARVTRDGSKWGLIDHSGALIAPCQWDEVRGFHDGMAAVRRNGKWGYINNLGHPEVPCEWDWACDFFHWNHTAVVCRLTEGCDVTVLDDAYFSCILDKEDYDTYLVEKYGDRPAEIYPQCRTCVQRMVEDGGSNRYLCPECGKRASLEGSRLIWEDAPEFPRNPAAATTEETQEY